LVALEIIPGFKEIGVSVQAKKILVVDDEKKIVDIVKAYLEKEGFQVLVAYDGTSVADIVRSKSPDLIVLDLMLPGISGWDVCREVRKTSEIPIIMLTARDEAADKIVGLELGADDYVTKPFNPNELVSRVRAVLRRAGTAKLPSSELRIAGLAVDIDKHTVFRDGHPVDLTATEFELLKIMVQAPGRVFSRMQLLDNLQDKAYEGYERTIDSHIKNLRKKIEVDPDKPRYVITVYGVGYKVEDKNAS
jgi:two-component system OmpR family response regulator